jgi:hypothetical protein
VAHPTVLQYKVHAGSGNGSPPGVITLDAAPTAGNLLVAFVVQNPTAGAFTLDTTKWTLIEATSSTYGKLVYRYVVGGDTAALPAFGTAGNTYWEAAVVEIQGVSGTFATDVKQHETGVQSGSSSVPIGAMTTDATNQLVLVWIGEYNNTTASTYPAGWTKLSEVLDFSNYGSEAVGSQLFASSGASVTCTLTTINASGSAYAALRFSGDVASPGNASGSLPSDTATAPAASGVGDVKANASLPSDTASAPTAQGQAAAEGDASLPTATASAPSVGNPVRTTQEVAQVLYTVGLPPGRSTQAVLQTLYTESRPARSTQVVLQVLWSGPRRIRRMGANIQAKRIEPFTNPILQDAWPMRRRGPTVGP